MLIVLHKQKWIKWIIWSSSSRASYMDSSIDSLDQAEPPELTYIDIDPFLESF